MPKIRDACLDDVPALARLLGQLFQKEAEFSPDFEAQARGLSAIIGDRRVGRVLAAEVKGEVVGMVSLLYTVSTALGARVAILEDAVVDRACRGRGIGKRLIAEAIERARADGCQRITLLSDHDNARAHRLYESFGFSRSPMVPFRLPLPRTLSA